MGYKLFSAGWRRRMLAIRNALLLSVLVLSSWGSALPANDTESSPSFPRPAKVSAAETALFTQVLPAPQFITGQADPSGPGADPKNIQPLPATGEGQNPPTKVNLQIDVDTDQDAAALDELLRFVEARGWRSTVYVPGSLADQQPALVRNVAQRGHEIGVHGWQAGEDLTLLSYDDQLALITRAWQAVQRALGSDLADLHFKPQGLRQNADTYQALMALHARSTTGLFLLDGNLFRCAYCERAGLGRILFPYPMPNKLVAVPVTEVREGNADVVMSDRFILAEKKASLTTYLAYLQRAYQERRAIGPMTLVVQPSALQANGGLELFEQFLDEAQAAGSDVVPTGVVAVAAGGYITLNSANLDSTDTCAGGQLNISGSFSANLYCPTYYIRAYGKYPSQSGWQLLSSVSYYPTNPHPPGTYNYNLDFSVPQPPTTTDTILSLRVVGRACQGGLACWPTADSYESILETSANVMSIKGIKVSPATPETTKDVTLEAELTNSSGTPKFDWTVDPIGSRTKMSTGAAIPQVKGSVNPYKYTPAVDTHGEKRANVVVTWTLSGKTCESRQTKDFKVFFVKQADDDGNSNPNWFDYWKADKAVPQMDTPLVFYDPALGNDTYGYYDPGVDKVRLGGAASLQHYNPVIVVNGISFGGPSVKGIDTAAEVIVHELRHKMTTHDNWAAGGAWAGKTDTDQGMPTANNDDDLPDEYELGFGTSISNTDTYDLQHIKSPEYYFYGDNEYDAMIAGNHQKGAPEKDWANPGKQTQPPYLLAAQVKSAGPAMVSGPPSAPTLIQASQHYPSLADFSGTYSSQVFDTDGDAMYNTLVITAGMIVTAPAAYNVVGWLQDSAAHDIAWASTSASYAVGSYNVPLSFDGRLIRASGYSGPYKLARAELRIGDHGDLASVVTPTFTTAAYANLSFQPFDVSLSGSYSDAGRDTDGDTRYNFLDTSVGLSVYKAGSYTVTGALYNTSGQLLASASTSAPFSSGNQTATLSFDGFAIRQWRTNGPYRLSYVSIVDGAGNRPAFALQPYTTTAYAYTLFQRGAAELTDSYSDTGVDTNYNGKYDVLRASVGINVLTGSLYSLMGTLSTANGQEITWASKSYTLTAGAQTVALDLDGRAIGQTAVNGPYRLTGLTLHDATGTAVAFEPKVYSTTAYAYTSFEGTNTILGAILNSSGAPTTATVELIGPVVEVQTTDATGDYRFDGLADGGYNLYATSSLITQTRGTTFTSVFNGQVVTKNIQLALAGAITGTVLDAAGQPVTGTSVYYSGFETPRYGVDANGRFVVPGLTGLKYTLYINSSLSDWWIYVNGRHEANGTQVDVVVPLGQVVRVDFRRPPTTPIADLSVKKSVADGAVAANEIVQYTLHVRNLGSLPTSSVRVTDTLPTGATYITDTTFSGFTRVSASGGRVVWTKSSSSANSDDTIDLTVRMPASIVPGNQVINTLSASGDAAEAEYTNNVYDDVQVAGAAVRDLTVQKWMESGIPLPGEDLQYAMYVRNDGNTSAANILVTDTLPAGMTYVSDLMSYGFTRVMTGSQTVWSSPSLAVGDTRYFYVTAHISDAIAPSSLLTNTVSASTSHTETNTANNVYLDTHIVLTPTWDLGVYKYLSKGQMVAGRYITYTIVVDNSGNSAATNVRLTDTLPLSLTYRSWGSQTYWPPYALNAFTPTVNGNTIVWNIGSVPKGSSGYFYVGALVDSNLPAGVALTNTADISLDQPDSNPSDNHYSYPLTSQSPTRDPSVSKYLYRGYASPGGDLTYNVSYDNWGNSPIENVVVTDTLPALLTNLSFSGPFAPTVQGNRLVWNLGTVGGYGDDDASGQLYITGHIPETTTIGTVLTNTVVITTSSQETGYTYNNQDTDVQTVQAATPDLFVTKELFESNFVRGSEIRYRVYYGNYSSSAAPTSWMTDTLPAGVSFVSASGPVAPTVSGNQVVWNLGTVQGYTYNDMYITAYLSDAAVLGSELINNVVIATPYETNPGNNAASDPQTVISGARDLGVYKYLDYDSDVRGGNIITFSLSYQNSGQASARNVILTDTLPAGLSYVSFVGDFTPTVAGNLVVWNLGTVPGAYNSGFYGSFYLQARLADTLMMGARLTNTLTIATSDAESATSDNVTRSSFTVSGPPLGWKSVYLPIVRR